jgi:hypothetical protein
LSCRHPPRPGRDSADIESGSPDPQGNYRWLDAADQHYAEAYPDTYNYTLASVQVVYYSGGASFQDGPLKKTTFTGGDPDPAGAYDIVYPETTVGIFGEWERLPIGGINLLPGEYEGQLVLTEESFHGSGLAGS